MPVLEQSLGARGNQPNLWAAHRECCDLPGQLQRLRQRGVEGVTGDRALRAECVREFDGGGDDAQPGADQSCVV